MKNIELKVKVSNFKEVNARLKKIGAKRKGLLRQKDTYYNHPNGRLKIREIDKKHFEVIFYSRPNTRKSKISNYHILPIRKTQIKKIKQLFHILFNEKVIINKSRQLWILGKTRIHLDKVYKLGNFLELETVITSSKAAAMNEHRMIIKALGLNHYKHIRTSYSDLVHL